MSAVFFFFAKPAAAADRVTQRRPLHPGGRIPPKKKPQTPPRRTGCDERHRSHGVLRPSSPAEQNKGARSPGRPVAGWSAAAGTAVERADRRTDSQPATHNVCNAHSCCLAALQRCLRGSTWAAGDGRARAVFSERVSLRRCKRRHAFMASRAFR